MSLTPLQVSREARASGVPGSPAGTAGTRARRPRRSRPHEPRLTTGATAAPGLTALRRSRYPETETPQLAGHAVNVPQNELTTITASDLDVLAHLTAARFADREQEARRLAQLDEVNGALNALSRTLATLGRHSLSECRGSHSRWDVTEDARAFYHALSTYAALVRTLAAEHRELAAGSTAAVSATGRRRSLSIL